MKNLVFLVFIMVNALVASAQRKLSGEIGPIAAIGYNRYTHVNWEISYRFEKRNNDIYLVYSNPRVTVPSHASYATPQRIYSKGELGIGFWPESNPDPSSLNVQIDCITPYGTTEKSGFAISSSGNGVSEDWVCAAKYNGKELDLSAFRLVITRASYNTQPVRELDNIINQRKAQSAAAQSNAGGYSNSGSSGVAKNNGETDSPAPTKKPSYILDFPTTTPSTSAPKDNFSKTVDAVATAVTLTSAVIDLFGGNKKQKSVEELLAEDGIGSEADEKAAQLKAQTDAANAAAAAAAELERSRKESARLAREALISSRTAVISPFSSGKVPRTIASEVKQLYYFYSSYQPSSLDDSSFELYVSNIFVVKPYGDGTWPFTEQLLSDLAKINPGHTVALAGEFTTMENAEEKLAALKQNAANNGMTIGETKFAGKNTGDGQTDYWGTAVNTTPKKAATATQAKESPQSDADYWGTATVTAPVINPTTAKSKTTPAKKAVPVNKVAPAAKANPETKTVEVDYWGNPVKN
jgi:hypothetical protein